MSVDWHAHPDVWTLVATLGAGYAIALRRLGPRLAHPIERVATRRQIVVFGAGLATILLAAGSPLHDLGERLFTAHMVEHLLLALVAPALLLTGTPDWLLRWLLRPQALLRAVRFLTRPLIALVAFNATIALIHAPWVVDAMVRSEAAHLGFHALLFSTALLMWMPVVGPLIELPALSYPGRMFYLFAQSIVPTVPASFLTFGDSVLYRVYETAVRPWGLSALADQQIAGLVMKIGGGFLLWAIIAYYFFKWFALEEREGVDVLEWHKVERDLNRADPIADRKERARR